MSKQLQVEETIKTELGETATVIAKSDGIHIECAGLHTFIAWKWIRETAAVLTRSTNAEVAAQKPIAP